MGERAAPSLWHFATVHVPDGFNIDDWWVAHRDWVERECEYFCGQLERGADTGALHLQLMWKRGRKVRPHVHNSLPIFDLGRGNYIRKCLDVKGAHEYCMKEDTRVQGPVEWGDFADAHKPGKRSDLDQVYALVKEGKSLTEIADENPAAVIRYGAGIERLRRELDPPGAVVEGREVYLCWGKPGCGKSYWVRRAVDNDKGARGNVGELWVRPSGGGGAWFDGYKGQPVALFDEFKGRASNTRLDHVLQWIDEYPARVEVKGSTTWFTAKWIWFTTNTHPRDWYDYSKRSEEWGALKRRFTGVFVWDTTDRTSRRLLARGTDAYEQWWGEPEYAGGAGGVGAPGVTVNGPALLRDEQYAWVTDRGRVIDLTQ